MRATVGGAMAVMLVLGAAGLCGCNRGGGSAAQGGDEAASTSTTQQGAAYASDRSGQGRGGYGDESAYRAPVPLFHGEPMWSQNRSHTAKENAEYHFERAGQDLGAKTLDDFLTKVHRFGDHPPPGTLKLTRTNGDRLLYDPKANLFAVFTRDGAPRTVFKPNTGIDYWREQKTREAQGDGGYGRRGYGGYHSGYGGGEGQASGGSGEGGDQGG